MTQSALGSRKRGRVDGDEESRDFTPLSKRINNLHINNGTYCGNPSTSFPKTVSHLIPCGPSLCNGRTDDGIIPSVSHQEIVPPPMYSPDLSISDNPFYYEPNKLLYYLYVERMQRSGQSY